jgi:hypothetical protein
MNTKKAVLVGINKYKDYPLRGCINDVVVIHQILTKQFGFRNENIKILTDEEATKSNMIDSIKWLTQGVGNGDSIVFHYSGHGSQISCDDLTATNEIDNRDEILIPYDHSWSDPFRDNALGALFKRVPKDCTTLVILDNCHSGTGLRNGFTPGKLHTEKDWVNRFISPPISNTLSNPSVIIKDDLSFDFPNPKQNSKAFMSKFLINTVDQGDAILLAGCQENQTSADAWIGNRYQGAMTYALAAVLTKHNYNITYKQLITEVNAYMDKFKYIQNPQLECRKEFFNHKFLR